MNDDLIPDCPGYEAEDEPLLTQFIRMKPSNFEGSNCHRNQIPCVKGHSRCFEFKNMCLYDHNEHMMLRFDQLHLLIKVLSNFKL